MTKLQFLLCLRDKLIHLPQNDVEERLNFYSEMIEDRMEEGLSETEAVSAVGDIDEIAAQILADTSIDPKPVTPKRKRRAWEILLLAIGSPLWLSLLIAFAAVLLSLYVSLWAVIVSLWAVFVSMIACALIGIAMGIGWSLSGNGLTGIALIGAGLVCVGVSVFWWFGCKGATNGILLLTKKMAFGIKNCFVKKEGIQ